MLGFEFFLVGEESCRLCSQGIDLVEGCLCGCEDGNQQSARLQRHLIDVAFGNFMEKAMRAQHAQFAAHRCRTPALFLGIGCWSAIEQSL